MPPFPHPSKPLPRAVQRFSKLLLGGVSSSSGIPTTTCSCSTFRIQRSQVAPSSCWDLLRSCLLQSAGDRVPSPLGMRGARCTVTQPLSTGQGSRREQGSQEPPSPGPGPLAGGPLGFLPLPSHTHPTAAAAGVRFMWMPLGFCKEKRVCVHQEGRKPTFIKVLLCGRHICKHHFHPTLSPGRNTCLEGQGEDELRRSL